MASSQAFMEYLKKSPLPESRTGRDPGRESGDVSGAIRTLPQTLSAGREPGERSLTVLFERLFSS
jgi:hypothetical protein